jgi:hypothetical protein
MKPVLEKSSLSQPKIANIEARNPYVTVCVTARQFLTERKAHIGTQLGTSFSPKTELYKLVITTGYVTGGQSGSNIICIRG